MNRVLLAALVALVMLYPKSVLADGGTLLIAADRDGYRITVFASPAPLRAGPMDVSVLVQYADTGKVVADARVDVALFPSDSGQPTMRSVATGEAATNKLFRAALFSLPKSGQWRISTAVTVDDRQFSLERNVEVAAALPHFSDLWLWTGWPAVAVGLFIAHRSLVRRSQRPKN